MALDYGSIAPGYKNPLGSDAPSIRGSYDWGSFSNGTDWNQTPGIDRTGLFESLFDKAKSRNKYRSEADERAREDERRANSWGGQYSSGGAQRVTEDASVYTPPQMSPFTIQGVQGSPGFLGGGGGKALATIGGLALAPMTGGASLAFAGPVGDALGSAGRTWNI